jgi:hypothetical protein
MTPPPIITINPLYLDARLSMQMQGTPSSGKMWFGSCLLVDSGSEINNIGSLFPPRSSKCRFCVMQCHILLRRIGT